MCVARPLFYIRYYHLRVLIQVPTPCVKTLMWELICSGTFKLTITFSFTIHMYMIEGALSFKQLNLYILSFQEVFFITVGMTYLCAVKIILLILFYLQNCGKINIITYFIFIDIATNFSFKAFSRVQITKQNISSFTSRYNGKAYPSSVR